MWTIPPIFSSNAEFGNSRVDALSQGCQLRAGLNPDPEYARSLRRWEESISPEANLKRAGVDSPQALGDRIDIFGFLLSNELQRNMK
jgi:hypothetical protein